MGVVIVIFFIKNGVNFDKFRILLEWYIKEGIDVIVICGIIGEVIIMIDKEKKDIIKFIVDVINKRILVIVGIGLNNIMVVIEMSKYVESVGVDGLFVIILYYNKII